MPSGRGLLKVGGAAFAGIAATVMFAGPAMACHIQDLSGKGVCDSTTGTVTVDWFINNESQGFPTKISVTGHTPASSKVEVLKDNPGQGANSNAVVRQVGVASNTPATITIHIDWDRGRGQHDKDDKTFTFKGQTCTKTPDKPKPTPTNTKPGGNGGGAPAPTPSVSTTTAAPGGPSLPLTGPNAMIYGGTAVGLVGAGTGLFFMARRRRIKFEA
jgi:LPXTG-motif cell wall-anchored protein